MIPGWKTKNTRFLHSRERSNNFNARQAPMAADPGIATTMTVSRMSRKSASWRNSVYLPSLLLALLVSVPGFGATDEPLPVFETDVLPIFQQHCLACHSESPQHGLDLRDLQKVVKGGESGIVVTPGSARTSLKLH